MRIKGNGFETLRAVEGPRLCLIMRYLSLRGETVIIHRQLLDTANGSEMKETCRAVFNCRSRASKAFAAEVKEAESEGFRFNREFPRYSVNYDGVAR
jgi:hypothetical protein